MFSAETPEGRLVDLFEESVISASLDTGVRERFRGPLTTFSEETTAGGFEDLLEL